MSESTSADSGPRSPAPLPPEDLAFRVSLNDLESFEQVGGASREAILEALGGSWDWDGKRVLDFGCGVGRLLRHLVGEAEIARIEGCDMHQESIDWCRENLDPPFKFFVNGASPPLAEVEDGTYDLIIAISVFTHMAGNWAGWLAELQRVSKPGGILIATFHGPGMADSHQAQSGHPYLEEETGMLSLPTGEEGTFASVFHSRWWLEEHWGRAFEPLSIQPDGFVSEAGSGHGLFVGRRREELIAAEGLMTVEPDEPRETKALQRANAIIFEVAQGMRERAQKAELQMARRFALSDEAARKLLFRSLVGGARIRSLGSAIRRGVGGGKG